MSTISSMFEISGRERWNLQQQNWFKWNERCWCWCCCCDYYLNEFTFSAISQQSEVEEPFKEWTKNRQTKKCPENFIYLNFYSSDFFGDNFFLPFWLFMTNAVALWHFHIIICQVESSTLRNKVELY